jgi:hypothetical protein
MHIVHRWGLQLGAQAHIPGAAGVPVRKGLNMVETDKQEGPGAVGNGYLEYIDVQAGDFFIFLKIGQIVSGAFSIEVTGSAVNFLQVTGP